MIDPLDSLAFSMHSSKGVYAVLLGSGASTSAGIPTGWAIILDLIRKLAVLRGKSADPEPEKWFVETFKEQPSYSRLLDELGKTGSERQSILKGYIEPTAEEREQNRKLPTAAHKAMAGLVASGHIRVILTTNFDSLMESALESVGVMPTVIASADGARGAVPLVHAPCTLIKLHGDYRDTRIKNTPDELSHYDEAINSLIDRVFDEYGLIVCGWSADWDTALRGAIQRCASRRFTTYWAARGTLTEHAQSLVRQRSAQVVAIEGADSFFAHLADKVQALADYDRPHPLSTAMAVATLKRSIPDLTRRIQLGELLFREADRVATTVCDKTRFGDEHITGESFAKRLSQFEAESEMMMALMAAGCYWGEPNQDPLLLDAFQRLTNVLEDNPSLHDSWEYLRYYPALLCIYAGSIAALAKGRYHLLRSILYDLRTIRPKRTPRHAANTLATTRVVNPACSKLINGESLKHTPVSDRIFGLLYPLLKEYIPTLREYQGLFDKFEYIRCLVALDVGDQGSIGCFGWRCAHGDDCLSNVIAAEASKMGASWPLFEAGFFGGKLERLLSLNALMEDRIEKLFW